MVDMLLDPDVYDLTGPKKQVEEPSVTVDPKQTLLKHLRQLGKDVRSGACTTYIPLTSGFKPKEI